MDYGHHTEHVLMVHYFIHNPCANMNYLRVTHIIDGPGSSLYSSPN